MKSLPLFLTVAGFVMTGVISLDRGAFVLGDLFFNVIDAGEETIETHRIGPAPRPPLAPTAASTREAE